MGTQTQPIPLMQRPSKRDGKVFSGCWTCRGRRVKCDERRPNCSRCDAAGIACQGYSIRLIWKGFPDNPKATASSRSTGSKYFHRSKMPPAQAASPAVLTRAEVASIQHDLDGVQSDISSSSKGLFSVFCSQPLSVGSTAAKRSGLSSSGPNWFIPVSRKSSLSCGEDDSELIPCDEDRSEGTSFDGPQKTQSLNDSNVMQLHDDFNYLGQSETSSDVFLPSFSPLLLDESRQSVNSPPLSDQTPSSPPSAPFLTSLDDDISYELDLSLESSPDWIDFQPSSGLNSQTMNSRRHQKLLMTPHIDVLPAPADQKELIHHWVTSLYLGTLPVTRIDKPQHNMYMPIALAGLNSDFQESSGGIAVFHGICAASAFNLSKLRDYDSHFHQLATKHRQLALCHLRNCMEGDQIKNESVWAAIMTLVFQAGVLGQAHEWRAHVNGLRSLIFANSHLIRNSHVARGIYETYLCLTILGNIHTDDDLGPLLTEIPPDLDYVGSVHGITRPILEIVLKINSLASTKPFLSPTELDRLELQLLLYSPGNTHTEGLDDYSSKMLTHYSYVYYYAALIHFHRVLRGQAPDKLQNWVERAIEHLEATEEKGNQYKGCIWVWPCLVVSAECTIPRLQSRMLAWYDCKQRHGFNNLEVARNLVGELWRRRLLQPDNPEDLYWQDLIHGTEYDVLPL